MSGSKTHGKICYLEIPADDIDASAAFYRDSFGWHIRRRDDGSTAFDDRTGAVSGTWVTGRPSSETPGVLTYIMVDNIDDAVRAVAANGAWIVQAIGGDAPELTARFRDPGGNVLGLYEEPRN